MVEKDAMGAGTSELVSANDGITSPYAGATVLSTTFDFDGEIDDTVATTNVYRKPSSELFTLSGIGSDDVTRETVEANYSSEESHLTTAYLKWPLYITGTDSHTFGGDDNDSSLYDSNR
jgi:hypothetical protein